MPHEWTRTAVEDFIYIQNTTRVDSCGSGGFVR